MSRVFIVRSMMSLGAWYGAIAGLCSFLISSVLDLLQGLGAIAFNFTVCLLLVAVVSGVLVGAVCGLVCGILTTFWRSIPQQGKNYRLALGTVSIIVSFLLLYAIPKMIFYETMVVGFGEFVITSFPFNLLIVLLAGFFSQRLANWYLQYSAHYVKWNAT